MPSMPSRWPRAIVQRSVKPRVTRSPVGAPARSARQFVIAVVPSAKCVVAASTSRIGTPRSAAAASSAATRPSASVPGVVGALPRQPRTPSVRKQSVKVPPMSTPIA